MDCFEYGKINDINYLLQLENDKKHIKENIALFSLNFLFTHLNSIFEIHDSIDNIKFLLDYDYDNGYIFSVKDFEYNRETFLNKNPIKDSYTLFHSFMSIRGYILPNENFLSSEITTHRNKDYYLSYSEIETLDDFMHKLCSKDLFNKYLYSKLNKETGTEGIAKIHKV